jgi:Predicted O-methyltransferase
VDDLQHDGLRLIQKTDAFRFGTDAVLLADFAAPKVRERALDLGCGTGVIATLMAAHNPSITVDCIEIQEDMAEMAQRSVQMNALTERIRVYAGDLCRAREFLPALNYSLAVCNPPYGRAGSALLSESETKRIARHEGNLTPDALCAAAFSLLKTGGRLCTVFPAPRAFEMMRAMDKNRLAPKRIRTVHGIEGRAPKLVLIEGVKDGGEMLHWLEPLVLKDKDGRLTQEAKRIYHETEA